MMWDEQISTNGANGANGAAQEAAVSGETGPFSGGVSDFETAMSGGVSDFETAMAELEQTVRRLESGEAGLAEALALFQKGMALAAACDRYLTQAETVINQLVEQPDGSFETVAFVPETEQGAGGANPGDGS